MFSDKKHDSLLVTSWQLERSHFRRFRAFARCLRISSSSFSRYWPCSKVSRRKLVSIIFVKLSASCAPLATQRSWTPSSSISLIFFAFNIVRYSLHVGVAVLVTKSKRLLQSVAASPSGSELYRWQWKMTEEDPLRPVQALAISPLDSVAMPSIT